MKELTQELFLVHHRVHTPLGNNSSFQHFFHCVDLVGLFLFNFPDLSKATTANYIHEAEIILSDL